MNERVKLSSLSVPQNKVFHNAKEYKYPNGYRKVTVSDKAIFKDSGFEDSKERKFTDKIPKPKCMDNAPREDNVRRAKNKVFDIALLNDFEYFVTWTIDGEKLDRENPEEILNKVETFLKNAVKRKGLSYLLVPEFHKDNKGIHLHALISGNMKLLDSGTRLVNGYSKPLKLETIMKKKIPLEETRIVYNMPEWKYGYSTAIAVTGEKENLAKYITKYITKDLKKIFGKFYLAGGHLNRTPKAELFDIDYESVEAPEYICEATNTRFKYLNMKESEYNAI